MDLLENNFAQMSSSKKIGFITSWLTHPKGKNFSCSMTIFSFKLKFLFKILNILLKGKNTHDAISTTKREYMNAQINTIAKNNDGFLFYITHGVNLDIMREEREDFVDMHFHPKKGDIILDIGANMGTYVIESAKKIENGKIFAIEADPKTFSLLEKNISLNKLSNVTPLNIAVYKENTTVKLFRQANTAANSIKIQEGTDFVEVEAITLDSLISKHIKQHIDWIKIDVEGAEVDVLSGGTNLLSSDDGTKFIIEVHSNDNIEKLETILTKSNYTISKSPQHDTGISYMFAQKP